MKSQTLVQRWASYLKGGDEAKMARFAAKLARYIKDQISIRERKIEDLQDKLDNDIEDNLNQVIDSLDMNKLATAEQMDEYVRVYVTAVNNASIKGETIELEIANLKEEIANYNKIEKLIFAAAKKVE